MLISFVFFLVTTLVKVLNVKEKLLQALKTKYSNLGFSDKSFAGVAEYLATTITEEDKIETGITGVENLLKAFQAESDKIRTENANLKKQLDKKDDPKDESKNPKKDVKEEDVPEWAKSMIAQNKEMQEKIASFEAGGVQKRLSEKLLGVMKEKSIPEEYYGLIIDGRTFKDDAEVDTLSSSIVEKYGKISQSQTIDSLTELPRPTQSSGGGNKEATKEEVASIVNQIM